MTRKHFTALLLALAMLFTLSACGGKENTADGSGRQDATASPTVQGGAENNDPAADPTPTPPPTPTPTPTPTPEPDPYDAVKNYWSEDQLTQEWGPNQVVEHIFFHPIIAYPDVAFTSALTKGLDDWMVTVSEYNKILQSLYENDYILVAMEDVWSETVDENGKAVMVRNTLMLPEGKKPLIISFDDVNYYDYMLESGFTSKLLVGEDGQIWAECTDPHTGETFLTQELDATPILDNFVLEHPDFSLNGAKAVFSLTGYQGILGYRTQNDRDIAADDPERAAFEAYRQSEIDAVMPVIQRLKETGWTFGCHTWGHISLEGRTVDRVQPDIERWYEEVGSLVGETNILFYPYGGRADSNDVTQTGEVFRYLQSTGFRIFASVGIESYSKIKSDICAVICDRLHPDGTTLRWSRERYLRFYDAAEVMDVESRPDYGYDWD